MSEDEPMQTTIFGDEVAMSDVPHLKCTNDKDCKAPVDAHLETCPVELDLRKEFGY